MRAVRFGKFRHQIKIQSPVEVQDAAGEMVVSAWTDLATLHASITPVQGRETFDASQLYADVTHRVRCRYVAGVTPKHRVLYGVRPFDIERAINVEEADRELEILAIERV